ncbi:MAG: alpha/beta hydrolase [Hyphomicrobiales bacterium]|nr:alpha/beta hydrolase [Hyphomicrobiales bacterium]
MTGPEIAYRRQGEGPKLVLIHGYLGGSAMWEDQIAFLSRKFDIIAPDLPGFAGSSHLIAPDSIAGYSECILEFLAQENVDDFFLLGHSMGGMIVQQMALTAPARVKKLVAYGTGPVGVMPGRFETIDDSRRRLKADGLDRAAKRIAATWFIAEEAAPGYALCSQLGAQASMDAALSSLAAWQNWNVSKELKNISAPTLVIWGDRDRSYGWPQPESLWRGIPDCSLAVVPGCAHNVHMEKPDLFNRIVEDFLA